MAMTAKKLLEMLEDSGTGEAKLRAVAAMKPRTAEEVVHAFASIGHMGTVKKACDLAGLEVKARAPEFQSALIIGPAENGKGDSSSKPGG